MNVILFLLCDIFLELISFTACDSSSPISNSPENRFWPVSSLIWDHLNYKNRVITISSWRWYVETIPNALVLHSIQWQNRISIPFEPFTKRGDLDAEVVSTFNTPRREHQCTISLYLLLHYVTTIHCIKANNTALETRWDDDGLPFQKKLPFTIKRKVNNNINGWHAPYGFFTIYI